jgi:hypothetical protein
MDRYQGRRSRGAPPPFPINGQQKNFSPIFFKEAQKLALEAVTSALACISSPNQSLTSLFHNLLNRSENMPAEMYPFCPEFNPLSNFQMHLMRLFYGHSVEAPNPQLHGCLGTWVQLLQKWLFMEPLVH